MKRTHPRKRRKRSKSAEILLFLPSTFMVWGCYACCLHFFDLFSWTCDFEGKTAPKRREVGCPRSRACPQPRSPQFCPRAGPHNHPRQGGEKEIWYHWTSRELWPHFRSRVKCQHVAGRPPVFLRIARVKVGLARGSHPSSFLCIRPVPRANKHDCRSRRTRAGEGTLETHGASLVSRPELMKGERKKCSFFSPCQAGARPSLMPAVVRRRTIAASSTLRKYERFS